MINWWESLVAQQLLDILWVTTRKLEKPQNSGFLLAHLKLFKIFHRL